MRRLTVFLIIAASCTAAVAMAGIATGKGQAHAADLPDGRIVFMRPGTIGEYDLWAVRPNGTGLRRLTESPANRSDYNPNWAPDGSVVLFERRKLDESKPGSDEALYEVDPRGAAFRQITHCHGRCWSDAEPAWSASGKRIAFGRATGPRTAPGPSLVAIYVANADGSNVRQMSKPPHGYEDHYPDWSPNGRPIVFQRVTSARPPTARGPLQDLHLQARRHRLQTLPLASELRRAGLVQSHTVTPTRRYAKCANQQKEWR